MIADAVQSPIPGKLFKVETAIDASNENPLKKYLVAFIFGIWKLKRSPTKLTSALANLATPTLAPTTQRFSLFCAND